MRLRSFVTSAVVFLVAARANADETPPPPPPIDPIQQLIDRQAQLEAQITALQNKPPPIPLAGYSDKNFFLRDPNDLFVLVPKGRLNLDLYTFPSRPSKAPGGTTDGPADNRPRDTLFIRRARLGLAGTIAKHIDFRVEADFASVATAGQYATVTDASIVVNYTPLFELEMGQFYTPFSLENPTSENFTDFMEKAAPVRFAVPTSRETGAMIFGAAPHNITRYWIGLFDGEGQNFKNLDYHPAVIGRAVIAPLAAIRQHPDWFENIWVGASAWEEHEQNIGGLSAASTTAATQGDVSPFTTQGGISYFNSNYGNGTDANKNAIRTHLAPNGLTRKYAVELNVPLFDRLGFRGEVIHQQIEMSEYNDTSAGRSAAIGHSNLEGTGGYAEAYVWLGQSVNVDLPGLYQVPHWDGYKVPGPIHYAVQVAAKYEHVGFDVGDLAKKDPGSGSYTLDVFELGTSLWMTRHSRLMANWVVNYIGGGSNDPAANEQKNLFFRRTDHELLFRAAASL